MLSADNVFRGMFSNSISLGLIENSAKSAAMQIWAVFGTRECAQDKLSITCILLIIERNSGNEFKGNYLKKEGEFLEFLLHF